MRTSLLAILALSSLAAAACSSTSDTPSPDRPSPLLSNEVTLLDFEFDGELIASDGDAAKRKVTAQLFYLVGVLNPDNANARISFAELSRTETSPAGDLTLLKYHAKIPVAWPKNKTIPASYALNLPRRMDEAGQSAFYDKYNKDCKGDEDEGREDYWHDWRPLNADCKLDAADVVTAAAKVTKSAHNTEVAYPEYDKVWSDGVLTVVTVFGKDSLGATSNSDIGIQEYNEFIASMRRAIPGVKTTPATVAVDPGATIPDVTLEGTLEDGGKVKAVAILVDNARTAGAAFETRFADVTKDADFVGYSGHSGLSRNTNAVAKLGTMTKGQYQIWFFNGCNSYAYLDQTLFTRRAAVNAPNDPEGTKNMDVVGNVLPAFFGTIARSDVVLIKALMDRAHPKSYGDIFKDIPTDQEVVVEGEEDNTFKP